MKLLLDECVPEGLRHLLPGHEVFTVRFMKWSGIGNGRLLRVAADGGFDALVTVDGHMEEEQKLPLPVAVVVLVVVSNDLKEVRTTVPGLRELLANLPPCQFSHVWQPPTVYRAGETTAD